MRSLSGTTKNQAFLETVRARRRELNIRQKVIAYEMGVTTGAYTRLERGATDLKFDIFIFLCQRLGINGEKFLN